MEIKNRHPEMEPAAAGRKEPYVPVLTEVILMDCEDVIRTSDAKRGAFDADEENLE